MRPSWIAALAWCAGLCCATTAAYAVARLNVWLTHGDQFQLGYVIGYLDAVQLSKNHDVRAFIPSDGRPQYERWRDMVNEFFAKPENANRAVADGMKYAGDIVQAEKMKALSERLARWRLASPSPAGAATPSPAVSPTGRPER